MKAIVYDEYGPPEVMRLAEVEKPTPKDDEALVEVHAASINYVDGRTVTGESLFLRLIGGGLRRPKHKILGDDVAGRVEAIGSGVTRFQPGDEVFGMSNFGAFAEYACVRQHRLALKPTNLTFGAAAAVPEAGLTALVGLRDKGRLRSGQRVLINGASGGVGTFAVQIAKALGAEVTGVCSTSKLAMVRSIGADHVVDYTVEDFTRSGRRYDLVFDIAAHRTIFDQRRALTPEGVYLCVGGSMGRFSQALLVGPVLSMFGSQKLGSVGLAVPGEKDFAEMKELLEAGKVVPVIDRRYSLSETPEALRYFIDGRAQGKLVITM